MKDQLTALARELGFEACAFASVSPVHQEGNIHPVAASLSGDARSILPDAGCVMLCAKPYRPFRIEECQAHVDAYYLSSNAAHEATQTLARRIEETLGLKAIATPPIYVKPLAVRSGLGEFGRNGLVSVGRFGTRVSLHAILLNAEIETHDIEEKTFSDQCLHCGACVKACPTGALDGTGRVNIAKCLRAQPEGEPFPEALREKLGGCLLGCDLCQRACPRNAAVSETNMPEALIEALDLSALLEGVYQPLIPLLGKNNARRQRLTARALIAAANLGRADLLSLIEPLTGCEESEMVKEHAKWAMEQLSRKSDA